MIQRLAVLILIFTVSLGYALESDQKFEQTRNVFVLEKTKVKIVAKQLYEDVLSGKIKYTETPTQVVKKGSPTPTATPTVTPTATATATPGGKVKADPILEALP